MQSNDARLVRSAAIPTAVAGIVAVAVSASLTGAKGAVGAAFGVLLVGVFFAIGVLGLGKLSRMFPEMIQAMAFLIYISQLVLLAVVMAVFKDTTLFDTQAFGISLLAATVVWVIAMVRAHLKLKIMYVEPENDEKSIGAERKP